MLKINGLYLPMLANRMVTGTVFFVGNTSSNRNIDGQDLPSHGNDPRKPFASIDYAIGKCVADNDDLIVVLAGHTEVVSSATDWVMDVAGVSIVGMGRGASRPTITFDTVTSAAVMVTAANCSIENMILTANYPDIVTAIDVDAVDFMAKEVAFFETTANMNWLNCVVTDDTNNAADGMTVIDSERISVDADAACLAFVSVLGNIKRMKIIGNYDSQASATDIGHFITLSSKIALHAQIIGNTCDVTGDTSSDVVGQFMTGSGATCSGVVSDNRMGSLATTTELFDTATLDFIHFENYYVGVIAKNGKLWPAADDT